MDKTSSSALDQALSKKVKDAVPAHKLSEYIGVYMNDLYGQVNVTLSETGINLMFHELPLQTFHLQNDDFMAYHPLMGTVPFHFSFRAENGVIGVHLSLSPRTEAVFFRRNG